LPDRSLFAAYKNTISIEDVDRLPVNCTADYTGKQLLEDYKQVL
jgi:hypothetical protein